MRRILSKGSMAGYAVSLLCIILCSTSSSFGQLKDVYTIHASSQGDAGISSIDNPTGSVVGGRTKVEFTIKNYGIDTLSSVVINWEVNGIAQPSDTVSTNVPYDSNAYVSFVYYFSFGGVYTIKAWTSMPNEVADENNNNDTNISIVTIYGLPAAANASDQNIFTGNSVSIGAVNPNPFTGNVIINYNLIKNAQVISGVYDITGKEIQSIGNEMMGAGAHTLNFDGSALPAGMYFVRLKADGNMATEKIIKGN